MKKLSLLFCIILISCSVPKTDNRTDMEIKENFFGYWVLYSVNDTIVDIHNCAEWPNGFTVNETYTQDFYRYAFNLPNTLTKSVVKDEWNIFRNTIYWCPGFTSISKWLAANLYSNKMEQEHISILVNYKNIKAEFIEITEQGNLKIKYHFTRSNKSSDMEFMAEFKRVDPQNYIWN